MDVCREVFCKEGLQLFNRWTTRCFRAQIAKAAPPSFFFFVVVVVVVVFRFCIITGTCISVATLTVLEVESGLPGKMSFNLQTSIILQLCCGSVCIPMIPILSLQFKAGSKYMIIHI